MFAVEPVGNLRRYIKVKARHQGLINLYTADGVSTDIPFPDHFADVTMSGHVFGDSPQMEYQERVRVTQPGGMLILCPGTSRGETPAHTYLLSQRFFGLSVRNPLGTQCASIGKHLAKENIGKITAHFLCSTFQQAFSKPVDFGRIVGLNC